MEDGNVTGIKGEYRRFTAVELGEFVRRERESRRVKRASLAVDAKVSEKTLERLEQ